jgi:hypothetical protein
MGSSDSPYVTETGGATASSADTGTQAADQSVASSTETHTAAPDRGAGGGEAFDNLGGRSSDADTSQQETTNEAGPDTPQQVSSAPDGGAGGGEAFDNPDQQSASPPEDSEQQDRHEIATDDQPTDDQPTDDQPTDDQPTDDAGQLAADQRAIAPEAQKIAAGHAYQDHVVDGGEYPEISTPEEFEGLVNEAMTNPSDSKPLERDRTGYWHDDSETVVIVDPNHPDGGTAFRPYDGRDYYDKQLK